MYIYQHKRDASRAFGQIFEVKLFHSLEIKTNTFPFEWKTTNNYRDLACYPHLSCMNIFINIAFYNNPKDKSAPARSYCVYAFLLNNNILRKTTHYRYLLII